LLSLSPAVAHAQNATLDDLLEKLKEKGVLSDDEYQSLKKAREEEQLEERDAHRRQAVKEAEQAEAQAKAKEAEAKATKFDVNPGIKSLQLYGDVRLRYEARNATSTVPIAGISPPATAEGLDRWRYAVRVGIRGDLVDDWYYGLRLETGTNPRSTWATFGGNTTIQSANGGAGPSAKGGSAAIQLGQAYLGWRTTPWLSLQAGKMPNPLYTTPMVWDPDIAPEGIAERVSYKPNDALELYANFMQMIYEEQAPDQTQQNVDLGIHKQDAWLYAWQAGAAYKFNQGTNVKAGLTYYQYMNRTNLNGFTGDGPPATTAAYFLSQNGINNLQILELPAEFNFPLFGFNARIFGDVAKNLDGGARAKAAGHNGVNEDSAYQIGVGYGNLGLVYGTVAKKGTWEVRTYWQRVEQFALDPNLMDSDFFEGRTNLQGVYLAGAYSFTDAIIGTLRWGYAQRINKQLGTGGSNPDLPGVNPVDDYRLLQVDLTWKF
jgi:hypothetical protein